ncbi:MAG: LOG family protein [Polyangiales bacterium]
MDERKALMLARSDAFVALPGGFGTLDELFEVATLVQIGELTKPVALMDHAGFWAGLHTWIDRASSERLRAEPVRGLIARCDGVEALLAWVDGRCHERRGSRCAR